jgi:hypothetical protein
VHAIPECVSGKIFPRPEASYSKVTAVLRAVRRKSQTLTELSSRRRPFDAIGKICGSAPFLVKIGNVQALHGYDGYVSSRNRLYLWIWAGNFTWATGKISRMPSIALPNRGS